MSALPTVYLRLCTCVDRGDKPSPSCAWCEGSGLIDQLDRPFRAPAPFDSWEPRQLVALSEASRERSKAQRTRANLRILEATTLTRTPDDTPAVAQLPRRRLTKDDVLELALAALSRSGSEHSSVRLTRNAKGDTQIEVMVRTGEGGLDTVEQVRAKAEEQYDHLCKLYPPVTVDRPES